MAEIKKCPTCEKEVLDNEIVGDNYLRQCLDCWDQYLYGDY